MPFEGSRLAEPGSIGPTFAGLLFADRASAPGPLADVGHTLMQHGVGILSVLVFEGQEIILVSKVVSAYSGRT